MKLRSATGSNTIASPATKAASRPACIRGSREPITREMVASLTCPVLVAAGTEDVIGGQAEELASLIPGAQALPIPRRDHMLAVGDRVYKEGALAFLQRRP